MNMKIILMAFVSAALLSGCALIRGNNTEEINIIQQASTDNFEAYGAEKINVLGMASMKAETRCSAVDFFNYVVETIPEAEDMINVRMEEYTVTSGKDTKYSCKYTGLAISYTPLSLAESMSWKKAKQSKPKTAESEKADIVVISGKTEAPSCTPCACITCGCQPCAAFSSPSN